MKDTAEKFDIIFFPAQGGGGGGGGYGCARAILVVGILLGALLISGCHKDSFDFDEFTRPTTTTNSDDGTPRTPNIRISSTDRTAQEGSGQVVLVINSDDDAPAGGLAVMITIAGAMAGEFTANAPCTANLVCTVRILEDNRVVNLVLTPTSDSAEENSERWTASLVDSSNYNFAANNNVAFDITDPTTPGSDDDDEMMRMPVALPTLAELAAIDTTPTALVASTIGNMQSTSIDGVAITGFRYDDASNMPQVYVQLLIHAHLGIWTNGQVPTVITSPTAMASDFDHDFRYAFLGDNAVTSRPNSGTAGYGIAGNATYKGVNFFPRGTLFTDFAANTYTSDLQANGRTLFMARRFSFGSATAMVPDGVGGQRAVRSADNLRITLSGTITANGFTSTPTIDFAFGFFSDLQSIDSATFSGRFYDAAGYNPATADPAEIAGAGVIVDGGGMNDLHFGFIGRCSSNCAAGD